MREESGLCASRRHTNILYTHNDSGDGPRFYALDATTAHVKATLNVEGATSHDWEDIACGPCVFGHSGWCVYIGDIGGNTGAGGENKIFMVREPPSIHDNTLHVLETLRFTWDEHNAETLMVDPHGELYIISKVDGGRGKIYHIPMEAWTESSHRYHLTGGQEMPTPDHGRGPVAGDISPNGQEVLIKTYHKIFYWNVGDSRDYMKALMHTPAQVPYQQEHQGESVCWEANGSGYYTISEGTSEALHYYRRS